MPAGLNDIALQLDRLTALEPGPFPVVSLYLNLQPDSHGRDHYDPFLRKELAERLGTYETDGPQRRSLDADCEAIHKFVGSVEPSAHGLAVFASSGSDLFE